MQIQLKAPKIWVANDPVDFRKSINGLSALVTGEFGHRLTGDIYIFYNNAKNKLKLLSYHGNGAILIYKSLDKKKFILKQNEDSLYELTEKQLSWLLAGLDWIDMSGFSGLEYEDYF